MTEDFRNSEDYLGIHALLYTIFSDCSVEEALGKFGMLPKGEMERVEISELKCDSIH